MIIENPIDGFPRRPEQQMVPTEGNLPPRKAERNDICAIAEELNATDDTDALARFRQWILWRFTKVT